MEECALHRITQYIKPYALRMAFGMFIKFFGSVMDLLLPWILAYMIDTVVPQKSMNLILLWGGMMIVCSVIAVVGNIMANRMASLVARDITRVIRHDLFAKITYLSCAQIDRLTIPSLVSRLTTDTYNVHRFISSMQRVGIRAPILLLGGILITLTLDPVLTLVLLCTLPFIAVIMRLVTRKGVPLYTALQQAVDTMVRTVRESAAGIRVIKALSKTAFEKQRFTGINEEVARRERTAGVVMAITNPTMNILLNVGLTLVIIVGAYRVNGGLTQPGKILAFLSYFTIILNAMLSITRMFVMFSRGSASADRIAVVLEQPEDLKILPENHVDDGFHISFEHVGFSYHKRALAVEDISFALKRGETLGIIGATGCGKSTVIQLLMRLYDASSGTVRIGGDDVRSIPPEKLHTMFGITFQDDVLFAETITENVDFGRNLRLEQIRGAVADAQARDFVESIDEGYDYRLTSRGTNLSGGQKQRLLIARALAASPEILILDDSSSALDYRTDANLRRALGKHFNDTTTVIVAQRISSIMHADHILVLDEGREIGYGTHDELIGSCSLYREIHASQMGG